MKRIFAAIILACTILILLYKVITTGLSDEFGLVGVGLIIIMSYRAMMAPETTKANK